MPPKTHNLTGTAHVSGTRQRTFTECPRKYWWQYNSTVKVNSPETDAHRLGKRVHWLAEHYIRDGLEPDEVNIPDSFFAAVDLKDEKVHVGMMGKATDIFDTGSRFWPKGRKGVLVEEPFGLAIPGRPGEAYTGTMDVYDPGTSAEIVALWPGEMRVKINRLFGTYALPVVGDHKTTKDKKWIKTAADLSSDEQLLGYGMEALRRNPAAPAVLFQWVYYLTVQPYEAFPVRFWLDAETLRREWDALEKVSQAMVDVVQIGNYRDVNYNKSACSNYGGCYYKPLCFSKGDSMKDAKIWSKLNKPVEAVIEASSPAPSPAPAPPPIITAVAPGQVNPPVLSAPRFKRPAPPEPDVAVLASPEVVEAPTTAVTTVTSDTTVKTRKARATRPEAVAADESTVSPKTGFVLLVDCGLDKGGATATLIDVFGNAMKKAADDNNQPNWRFIPYTSAAALAMAVENQLDQDPVGGFIRLDTGTPEGNALLPLLTSRAFLVIRGY